MKTVAEITGVSIRTLHHYDAIGLLKPSAVSASGYRLYGDEAMERLQQVLFFKELGFSLQDIKRIIDSPAFDRAEALVAHRALLVRKQQRLAQLLKTLDRTINATEEGMAMDASRWDPLESTCRHASLSIL